MLKALRTMDEQLSAGSGTLLYGSQLRHHFTHASLTG